MDKLVEWSANVLVNLHWLLTGAGKPYINDAVQDIEEGAYSIVDGVNEINSTNKSNNVIDIDHDNIIRQFIDKSFARDINLGLVKIERMNPSQYREIGAYIKGIAKGLEIASKPTFKSDRRQAERRINDDKIQNGHDRRTGNDRRKTGI